MKQQVNVLQMILGLGLIFFVLAGMVKIVKISIFLVGALKLESDISFYTDLFTFIIICLVCSILFGFTKFLKNILFRRNFLNQYSVLVVLLFHYF